MVEIVKFLVKRARRERKGRINWPIGIPITLGDLGRVSRGLYVTEGVGSLQSLGIDFTEVPDTSPDSIDWQYSEDSELELAVKAKTGENVPDWSGLDKGEIGFSAKFGKKGSYRFVVPELTWKRIEMTPDLKAQLGKARRSRQIRMRDRLVVGIGVAKSYTLLISASEEAKIDFTAGGKFSSIADAEAKFSFKRSKGAVEHYVAKKGGALFLRLARIRRSGDFGRRGLESALESVPAADDNDEIVVIDEDFEFEDELDI